MSLIKSFLRDESGAILSAEAALLGTLGVVGATVGLSAATTAVQDELADVAYAFRSLDQSYSIPAQQGGRAWSAGSAFVQPSAAESVEKLRAEYERQKQTSGQEAQIPPAPDSDGVSY